MVAGSHRLAAALNLCTTDAVSGRTLESARRVPAARTNSTSSLVMGVDLSRATGDGLERDGSGSAKTVSGLAGTAADLMRSRYSCARSAASRPSNGAVFCATSIKLLVVAQASQSRTESHESHESHERWVWRAYLAVRSMSALKKVSLAFSARLLADCDSLASSGRGPGRVLMLLLHGV